MKVYKGHFLGSGCGLGLGLGLELLLVLGLGQRCCALGTPLWGDRGWHGPSVRRGSGPRTSGGLEAGATGGE